MLHINKLCIIAVLFAGSYLSICAMESSENDVASIQDSEVASAEEVGRKDDDLIWHGILKNGTLAVVKRIYRKRTTRHTPPCVALRPSHIGWIVNDYKFRKGRKKLSVQDAEKYATQMESRALENFINSKQFLLDR
jgi:hypothetical protein